MPHDVITERQDIIVHDNPGTHDRVILSKYEAPATGDGGIELDTFKTRDFDIAKTMNEWLEKHYPGHLWATVSDLRQGIIKFNIPILMGTDQWWIINLSTHDVIDGLKQGAGQILERYHLRRGRFEIDSFLDAREKHSRLVLPSRKVPE